MFFTLASAAVSFAAVCILCAFLGSVGVSSTVDWLVNEPHRAVFAQKVHLAKEQREARHHWLHHEYPTR